MVSCRNPALVNTTCPKLRGCCDGFKGPQIPDPIKFPGGIPPVVDYIHSKGLKAGLYLLREYTCHKWTQKRGSIEGFVRSRTAATQWPSSIARQRRSNP